MLNYLPCLFSSSITKQGWSWTPFGSLKKKKKGEEKQGEKEKGKIAQTKSLHNDVKKPEVPVIQVYSVIATEK